VFIVANANLNTLLNFRFQRLFAAGKGAQGQGSLRTGKSGADVTLHVPVGTVRSRLNRGRRLLGARLGARGHVGRAASVPQVERCIV